MREKVLADVTVVDSRDAALEVMRTTIPDVLLLSALLSPRDEDELIAHLRTVDAQHLQTHTIPQLASVLTAGEGRGGGGLLSAFRRKKKEPDLAPGCDPDLFAEEIRTYLQRAEDKKRELQSGFHTAPDMRLGAHKPQTAAPAPAADTQEETESSSWASPFEWKPAGSSSASARHAAPIAHRDTHVDQPPPVAEVAHHDEPVASLDSDRGAEPPIAAAAVSDAHAETILAEPEPEVVGRESLIPEPGVPKTTSLIAHPESVIITVPDSEDAASVRLDEPAYSRVDDPVVVMREPSVLISQPVSVLRRDDASMRIDETLAEDAFPQIELVDDPLDVQETVAPPYAAASEDAADAAAETIINLDAVSDDEPSFEPPPAQTGGFTFLDPGFAEDGFGDLRAASADRRSAIQDAASGIRGVGPLASWARVERRGGDGGSASDDLRMLLAGLAVPPAVAGVRYARGVRIRRVRVPASQAADAGDTSGPVILSRRALAEQREQTGA